MKSVDYKTYQNSYFQEDDAEPFVEAKTQKMGNEKVLVLPNEFHKYKDKMHLINIEEIMARDLNGMQAITFYKRTSELNPFHRTQIINVLIDFVLKSKIWIEKKYFPELTEKILSFFRTSNPNEYVSF